MKNKIRKSKSKSVNNGIEKKLIQFGLSLLVASGVTSVMLLLLSLVITVQNVPHQLFVYLSIFAAAVGAFTGGFVASKLIKEKGLQTGAILGVSMGVLIYTISLFFSGLESDVSLYLKLACILLFAIAGGVMGVHFKKRRKI